MSGRIRYLRPSADGGVETGFAESASAYTVALKRPRAEPAQELDGKEFNTKAARAALAGYSLQKLADGGFVIGKWNLNRSLDSLDEVEQFLERVGAR